MSKRIVLLGPTYGERQLCASVSSGDAEVILAGESWRVSLTMWAGDLSDATVLVRVRPWWDFPAGSTEAEGQANGWVNFLMSVTSARTFEVRLPIPVGDQ